MRLSSTHPPFIYPSTHTLGSGSPPNYDNVSRQNHTYRHRRRKPLQTEAVRTGMQEGTPTCSSQIDQMRLSVVAVMPGSKDGYVAYQDFAMIVLTWTRQALYRGQADGQDRLHLRVSLHRLRYLREKVRPVPRSRPPADLTTRCPFEAIAIINLPTNLDSEVTHRYTANSFKLHRLPTPRPGQVLGLVGTNGIGKSTALKILAGKLKPNLGRYDVRRAGRLCPCTR